MNVSDMVTLSEATLILHRAKLIIFLILQIPAIILTLLIFTYLATHRAVLKQVQHQSVFLLLLVNFLQLTICLSMLAHFYYFDQVIPATAGYCTWWTFIEYTLSIIGQILMATISVQRHTLIFQPQIFRVRRTAYLFYYLPLLLSFVYPFLFYLFAIVLYPCDGTQWDFTVSLCGYANCYLIYDKALGTFDWAVNTGLPVVVIVLANVTLIYRVISAKRRRQQPVTWRQQKRMTLQLLSISSLYVLAWLPNLIIGILQQLISPTFLFDIQVKYIIEVLYLVCLLLPWLCLGLLTQFKKWIHKHLMCRIIPDNVIRPM